MSIFEPIPRGSGGDHEEYDDEDDGFPADGGSFDPRPITIAGAVIVGIVVLGLVVSNTADREPQQRPLMPSVQVDPGAAAVEDLEATQSVRRPTIAPTTSPSVEPVGIDQVQEADDDPRWGERKPKWDDKRGNGNGNGKRGGRD